MAAQLHFGGSRRRWLLRAAATIGVSAVPFAIGRALAAGERPPAPGLYRAEGEVRINARAAKPGQLVRPGDAIETGAGSQAVFIVGRDAYLLRAGSRVETAGSVALVSVLRIVTGKLLSVLGPGAKRIETRTATIGIRGTGIYVEAEPERTYVCTCYGTAELQSRDRPEVRETVTTKHHEQPRYIYGRELKPFAEMMGKAPVINHTDAELIMLESLVGRKPPFVDSGGPPY